MSKRDILLKNLPIIVESFVSVYGNDYRDLIEDTIYNNINFVIMENGSVIDEYETFNYISDDVHLLYNDDMELVDDYCDGTAFTIQNFISRDGIDTCKPTVFLVLSDKLLIDFNLLHEINHCIESNIFYKDNKKIYKFSWSELEYSNDYSVLDEVDIDSKYSLLFNESINDLIAEEAYKYLLSLDVSIFDKNKSDKYDPDNKIDAGYGLCNIIIKDFYEKYKDIIIKSRICLDSSIEDSCIYDLFLKINDIVLDFQNYFYELDEDGMLIIDIDLFLKKQHLLDEYKDRVNCLISEYEKCKVMS